jgi:hypothetical protein
MPKRQEQTIFSEPSLGDTHKGRDSIRVITIAHISTQGVHNSSGTKPLSFPKTHVLPLF